MGLHNNRVHPIPFTVDWRPRVRRQDGVYSEFDKSSVVNGVSYSSTTVFLFKHTCIYVSIVYVYIHMYIICWATNPLRGFRVPPIYPYIFKG